MAAPQFGVGGFGLGGVGGATSSQSVQQAQSASSSYAGLQGPFGTGLGFGTGGSHYHQQSANAGLATSNLFG